MMGNEEIIEHFFETTRRNYLVAIFLKDFFVFAEHPAITTYGLG